MRDIFIDGYRVKEYNSSSWLQIYHQNTFKGGFFKDYKQCNFSLKKNLFSVIGLTDESFKISDKYHYLLHYKELNDAYFEWEQATLIQENVSSVPYSFYNKSFTNFAGIAPSYLPSDACFDGTPGDNIYTWYSIGRIEKYSDAMPGPALNGTGKVIADVSLYIKIDDMQRLQRFPVLKTLCTVIIKQRKHNFSLFLIIMIV